jgi:hypothetical protein
MTHKVTYVTKIASATIRVLNWFYGITLLFTTIIGLAMKNKIEKKEENMNQEENMNNDQYPSFFVCNNCGPAKPVYSEVFTTESSKPYKVELIQQSYLYPEIAEEIKIGTKPKGKDMRLTYCGHCGSPANLAFMPDEHIAWVQSKIKNSCEAIA